MTHQLHCLYAILESYAGMAVNGSANVDMHSHIPEGTEGAEGPWHLQHCFEYLRQVSSDGLFFLFLFEICLVDGN